MYDQCNLGGEDIYKYGVISGLYVSFVMVNINYDCVILVSVNVNMFRQSYFVYNGDNKFIESVENNYRSQKIL